MKKKLTVILLVIVMIVATISVGCTGRPNITGDDSKQTTVTVYAGDGKIIRKFVGVTNLFRGTAYVSFKYDGNDYEYHNCWVEIMTEK